MKKLFFALPFLLAGCQAERVAFQFQPVPPTPGRTLIRRSAPPAPAASVAASPTPLAEAAATLPTAAPAPSQTAASAALLQLPTATQTTAAPRPLAPETLQTPDATPTAALPLRTNRLAVLQHLHRLGRPHATAGPARTAESGLGGIGLFFIAIVLGLLAGLGALVSVIFGTGFFTGVGFAAAGLVVLFLLYSLLSGGKKKSKPVK